MNSYAIFPRNAKANSMTRLPLTGQLAEPVTD